MNDIFKAKEHLDELCECLIEEYSVNKNPELLNSIRDCSCLCFWLGCIIEGFGRSMKEL